MNVRPPPLLIYLDKAKTRTRMNYMNFSADSWNLILSLQTFLMTLDPIPIPFHLAQAERLTLQSNIVLFLGLRVRVHEPFLFLSCSRVRLSLCMVLFSHSFVRRFFEPILGRLWPIPCRITGLVNSAIKETSMLDNILVKFVLCPLEEASRCIDWGDTVSVSIFPFVIDWTSD